MATGIPRRGETSTRFRRAAAWTKSEVAKGAASGAKDAVEDAFENPTPWMRGVFGYKRALTRSGDDVSAELFVKPSQSIVLKYALGDDPQIRRPGDVGLAREKILVPHWRNLALTQGINRNAYGNLPGGVAARLAREAAGTAARRRVAGCRQARGMRRGLPDPVAPVVPQRGQQAPARQGQRAVSGPRHPSWWCVVWASTSRRRRHHRRRRHP